jgi:hypothetical protein
MIGPYEASWLPGAFQIVVSKLDREPCGDLALAAAT